MPKELHQGKDETHGIPAPCDLEESNKPVRLGAAQRPVVPHRHATAPCTRHPRRHLKSKKESQVLVQRTLVIFSPTSKVKAFKHLNEFIKPKLNPFQSTRSSHKTLKNQVKIFSPKKISRFIEDPDLKATRPRYKTQKRFEPKQII